jgi:outer membrane protein assembly factor BamA
MLTAMAGFAQTKDAMLWLNVTLEKKITKDFSLSVAEELRFSDNITELGAYFTDLGLNYKFDKHWRMSANYRFTNRQRLDDSYSKRHRYYFDLSYRNKFKPFSLIFRTRFQSQYTDVNSSATGHVPEYYWRNKLSLKYELEKKYTPYISLEMFLPVLTPQLSQPDGMRYTAGMEYAINKHATLDLYYMIQRAYNVNNPETDFVIGVGFMHDL